jgi:hypothetical protein
MVMASIALVCSVIVLALSTLWAASKTKFYMEVRRSEYRNDGCNNSSNS